MADPGFSLGETPTPDVTEFPKNKELQGRAPAAPKKGNPKESKKKKEEKKPSRGLLLFLVNISREGTAVQSLGQSTVQGLITIYPL